MDGTLKMTSLLHITTEQTKFRLKAEPNLSMVGSQFPPESLPIVRNPQEATASADADLARLEISLQQGCGDFGEPSHL
jgi:hypothetical protein